MAVETVGDRAIRRVDRQQRILETLYAVVLTPVEVAALLAAAVGVGSLASAACVRAVTKLLAALQNPS